MQEKPFFFTGENYKLFGILHQPEGTEVIGGFVFCHPFAEEKLWTHRVFVSFARELAKRGFAVLRFDYMGHGDSEGDFADSTVETRMVDIDRAIVTIKTEVPGLERVNLLGLRFGATLAAQIATQRKDIDRLIMWEPIVDGSRYMQEILRSNLTTQLAVYGKVTQNREALVAKMKSGDTVNIDGYEMSYTLFEQGSAINLIGDDKLLEGNVLVIQIGKQGQPLRKDLQKLLDLYKSAELKHAVEEPFWREIKRFYGRAESLFGVTLDWMSSNG